MKLMTFLGLALSVSVPAKAVYVDGGISCNPLYSVDADAVTELEFWEAYWYGFTGSFTDVQIYGPPGGASGSNYANFPSPAIAYASLVPEPGNYQYLAWHSISGGPWGQVLVYFGQASCDVPSAEIDSSWSIEDGDQTTFHVTTLGLTPTGYSWTFSSMGGGNNPMSTSAVLQQPQQPPTDIGMLTPTTRARPAHMPCTTSTWRCISHGSR